MTINIIMMYSVYTVIIAIYKSSTRKSLKILAWRNADIATTLMHTRNTEHLKKCAHTPLKSGLTLHMVMGPSEAYWPNANSM